MLDEKQLTEIEARADNAGLGYNTTDLPRHYARDVKALLTDRRQLAEALLNCAESKDQLDMRLKVTEERVAELEAMLADEPEPTTAPNSMPDGGPAGNAPDVLLSPHKGSILEEAMKHVMTVSSSGSGDVLQTPHVAKVEGK